MNNKLFLVCPFSSMENFIRQNYGDDVFYITAMAGIFQCNEKEWIEEIKYFISSENINEIFIVSDISCRFINAALNKEKTNGYYSERVIQKLVEDNYDLIMENKAIHEQQIKLAELIVKHQATELKNPNCLQQQIIQSNISIKELITSKAENKITELNFHANQL